MVSKRNSEKEKKAFKIKWISESLGITKQAYYQGINRDKIREFEREKVINMVIKYRKTLPKTGTVKLYEYLQPKLMEINIKMGRCLKRFIEIKRNADQKNKAFPYHN